MTSYTLSHLSDQSLLRELKSLVSQDHATTALLIAHLGEVDARRLYAPAGYPSMYEYCVQELRFSEQSAFKRIRVARTARQFPVVYAMLTDGRLNLSAVVMLTGYLTPENGEGLLAATANQTRAGIERLLAERFPQPDLPTLVAPLAATDHDLQLSPGTVKLCPTELTSPGAGEAPASSFPSLGTVTAKVAPLAPERFGVQFTFGQRAHDKLRYAQSLLGHSVPSGELAEVFERALDVLIAKLEQQKFAKTDRPRPCRVSENARQIPAEVKRTVWERDGGQCTFVSESGHRCEARTRLEFDHVEPVANGGHSTVQGLRLRCRAHNQLAAEQAFGRDFMDAKRRPSAKPEPEPHVAEVIPWLRSLGFKADEARRLAECCEGMPEAPLEARVRHALKCSARPQRGHAA